MRKSNLMKCVGVIFIFLTMMFSCQPVSEYFNENGGNNQGKNGSSNKNKTLALGGVGDCNVKCNKIKKLHSMNKQSVPINIRMKLRSVLNSHSKKKSIVTGTHLFHLVGTHCSLP